MNKFLHMNSLFTRIILGVLSFAVIICAFIPYFQIPAVKAVHDVNVADQRLEIYIGKDAETVNIISEFSNGQPFLIFSDAELTQTVERTAIPTPDQVNTYWVQFFAYGYDTAAEERVLGFVPISVYKLILNKGATKDDLTSVSVNKVEKTITISVPKTTTFDFSRVIDTKNVWTIFDNRLTGFSDSIKEARSIPVKKGATLNYYIAITLKSETNPMSTGATSEEGSSLVYYPLDMYELLIYRDEIRSTLPTVGEFGLGILSSIETQKNNGTMTLYTGDALMLTLMVYALISTIFSFVIPNKFRLIQTIVGSLLGLALIIVPVLDYIMFFKDNHFNIQPGMFILMALGVLILFFAVFDYIRCHQEYVAEQIHIYGEDAFKKKKEKKLEAEESDTETIEIDGKKALKKKEKKEKKKKD